MPEIEFKAEGAASDPVGQKVGVLAAVLAVALAVVSIASHRAHTMAVVEKTEANDQWSFYQSKRIKFHSLELGVDLVSLLGRDKTGAEQVLSRYETEEKRYAKESKDIEEEAKKKEEETLHTEARALRYDIGEGMLEIGVVMASLYFISRKKLFPGLSVVFGVLGCGVAVSGVFL
ncbi:MAG: hypothetical protein JWO19_232 [Bryobacterales bacterium]|nr:hypothetical protein [Bryobacterales bacterium]